MIVGQPLTGKSTYFISYLIEFKNFGNFTISNLKQKLFFRQIRVR